MTTQVETINHDVLTKNDGSVVKCMIATAVAGYLAASSLPEDGTRVETIESFDLHFSYFPQSCSALSLDDRSTIRDTLSENGEAAVNSILKEMSDAGISVSPYITTTTDKGVVIAYEEVGQNRELTFVIPRDGDVRYFVAQEISSSRTITGIVIHSLAYQNLGKWLIGEIDIIPDSGLSLPSAAI